MRDSQLNVYNLEMMRKLPPQKFSFVRFDPNNNCNVRCVYCHNHRSSETISTDSFRSFLTEIVQATENFQFGCIMEPTLDRRLVELMQIVSESHAHPRRLFMLQTNGTMLHMHDQRAMAEAGLNRLCVSIDAADAATHKSLRGGTSIAKVTRNLEDFHRMNPEIPVIFVTTVTRLNLGSLQDLVAFGLSIGASQFTFRQVFYAPDSDVVDHSRMPDLVLTRAEFRQATESVRAAFGDRAEFDLADEEKLKQDHDRIVGDSYG